MAKRYYTVAVKFERDDTWSAQFGDYDRDVCRDEIEDAYADAYKTKIIVTSDAQSEIDAVILSLNSKD